MQPVVNISEEDRATDIGNMHKNGKDRACSSRDNIYASTIWKKILSRRYAMQPIVNMSGYDRAMDVGNKHKKMVKIARVISEIYSWTNRQTDIVIKILPNRSRGRSNNVSLTW